MTHLPILGLTGYAGSGKDTVAGILKRDHGYTPIAFADPLKSIVHDSYPLVRWAVKILGPETAKRRLKFVRRAYQDLGESVREHLGRNTWVLATYARMFEGGDDERYVITDVRHPNEASGIRGLGGRVIRVNRPKTGPLNGHVSEVNVGGLVADYELDNSGNYDHLAERVREMIRDLSPATSPL